MYIYAIYKVLILILTHNNGVRRTVYGKALIKRLRASKEMYVSYTSVTRVQISPPPVGVLYTLHVIYTPPPYRVDVTL